MTQSLILPDRLPIEAAVGDDAHRAHEAVKSMKLSLEAHFLMLGVALLNIRENRLFEALDFETFEDYLKDPDVSLSTTQAYRMITIAEKFVVSAMTGTTEPEQLAAVEQDVDRLSRIGISKLELLGQVVTDQSSEDEIETWFSNAENLSVSDLRKLVKEARQGEPEPQLTYWEEIAQRIGIIARELPRSTDPVLRIQEVKLICDDTIKQVKAARNKPVIKAEAHEEIADNVIELTAEPVE